MNEEAVVTAGRRRAGKLLRESAIGFYGREQLVADWHADGRMRSKPGLLSHRAVDAGPSADGTGPRRP